MRFRRSKEGLKPSINITPLVDAVFILLIFFAVSTSFMIVSSIDVNLAEAQTGEKADKPKSVKVAITSDNKIYIDKTLIPENKLVEVLTSIAEDSPEATLIVEADKDATHGIVIKVIDAGKLAGFMKFAMSVEEP